MREIMYGNCWEDAEVVLAALEVRPGKKYITIASAGDVALALISRGPAEVVALDSNPAQLACLELRTAAFKHLTHKRLLAFMGIARASAENRSAAYEEIKHELSKEAAYFWGSRAEGIARGIVHNGQTERYFYWFRKIFLPLLVPLQLRENRSAAGRSYINRMMNSFSWSFFLSLFYDRRLCGRIGIGGKRQVGALTDHDIVETVRQRIVSAFVARDNGNCFLEYIMTGSFAQHPPFYLRAENYGPIRSNLSSLHFRLGEVTQALDVHAARYDGFYLSDIFEYMDEDLFESTIDRITRVARRGARIVYWNNLLMRQPDPRPCLIKHERLSQRLFTRNRAFFYGSLVVLERK